MSDLFRQAEQIDIADYLERFEGIEFVGRGKNKKALCPFHADTKPTFSITYKDRWFYKCFSCQASGDLVKFVQDRHGKSAIEAVKEILGNEGIDIGEETKLSEAELKKRAAKLQKLEKEIEEKRKKQQKEADAEFAKVQKKLNIDAPLFAENFYQMCKEDGEAANLWVEHIPHFYNLDDGIISDALGYDKVQESVCFLIRDDNGKCFNIKHRQKYVWDEENKKWLEERQEGKWLSAYLGREYPFGWHYWDEDERVVICEGEKDVLNLRSIGVNAVTLGGVSASWESWSKILAGRNVFIFFDNDKAGYKSSFVVYEQIKRSAKFSQMVMFFKLGVFEKKFDVSDFLKKENITNKDQLFDRIAYSCFLPNNPLIRDLIEYLKLDGEKDESDEKERAELRDREHLEKFLKQEKSREFSDIEDELLESVRVVRGTLDKEIEEYEKLYNLLIQSDNRKELRDIVISLIPEDQRETFQDKDIDVLEFMVENMQKLDSKDPVGRGSVKQKKLSWNELSTDEKRSNWGNILNSFNKK